MKKLLNELEKERAHHAQYQASAYDCGRLSGFDDALYIVRAHNPWHEVTELPEHGTVLTHLSIVVWCTDGESRSIGYYNYRSGMWYAEGLILPVIKWTYLPELPK